MSKNIRTDISVVILAGGFGTRMSTIFPGIPKPLVPVNGVPVLHHLLNECIKYGLTNVTLVLHYEHNQIIESLEPFQNSNLKLEFVIENKPLGTGGALMLAAPNVKKTVLVLYADVYSSVNLEELIAFHIDSAAAATLVTHPNSHPHDSDIIVDGEDNKILEVAKHPHVGAINRRNLVNAAMYVFSRSTLHTAKFAKKKFDLAQDLFPALLQSNYLLVSYRTVEYLKDMGTPERLIAVENDIASGVVAARDWDKPRRAVFLDRDGTLIKDVGHLSATAQVELLPRAADAVKKLNSSQYLALVVTNQPVLARGDVSERQLDQIHAKLDGDLGSHGAFLDDLVFCPHHPESGFVGEVPELKIKCKCRKPSPGMIFDLEKKYNIDLSNSWFIGDSSVDIEVAHRSGCRSVLLLTGAAGGDGKVEFERPTLIADDLSDAVNMITDFIPAALRFIDSIINEVLSHRLIFITGLSRAGKTVVASLLRDRLSRDGFSSAVLELDRFLRSDRTESMTLVEKYDLPLARKYIDDFLSNNMSEYVDQSFISKTSTILEYPKQNLCPESVLIVEGLPAFELASDWSPLVPRVFVSRDESDRADSFIKKYKNRGMTLENIMALWESRLASEDEFIKRKSKDADFIFNLKESVH